MLGGVNWRTMARGVSIALLCLSGGAIACATGAGMKGLIPADVTPERIEAAHAPRRLALLVGIGDFDDPEWRHLRYAGKDAGDLARVLADPLKGSFGQVETLSNGATKDSV